MDKINYLNVGCGFKYHTSWINIDQYSNSPDILVCDLFNKLPFEDNTFEVVYLSQVLEHFLKHDAVSLIRECHRVLKVNGVIRIAVPDLENIVKCYCKFLEENLNNPTKESAANYEWIMLEMYDQAIRNVAGGEMLEVMMKKNLVNEKFVSQRMGLSGELIRAKFLKEQQRTRKEVFAGRILKGVNLRNWNRVISYVREKTFRLILRTFGFKKELKCYEIGKFRTGGEIHFYMYDRYSLSKLLNELNFREVKVKTAQESGIPEWNKYELDVKNGAVYDPTAIFIEARK